MLCDIFFHNIKKFIKREANMFKVDILSIILHVSIFTGVLLVVGVACHVSLESKTAVVNGLSLRDGSVQASCRGVSYACPTMIASPRRDSTKARGVHTTTRHTGGRRSYLLVSLLLVGVEMNPGPQCMQPRRSRPYWPVLTSDLSMHASPSTKQLRYTHSLLNTISMCSMSLKRGFCLRRRTPSPWTLLRQVSKCSVFPVPMGGVAADSLSSLKNI